MQSNLNKGKITKLGDNCFKIHALSRFELGYLEGKALRSEILAFKRLIKNVGVFYSSKGYNYKNMLEIAMLYEDNIPSEYEREMYGMADAIPNISYKDIALQNCYMDIFYGAVASDRLPQFDDVVGEIGCSTIVLKKDNGIVSGENFDLSPIFNKSISFLQTSIGDEPILTSLRMGGILSLPIGEIADRRLLVSIVRSKEDGDIYEPSGVKCRRIMEQGKDSTDMVKIMRESPSTLSCNLMICDKNRAYHCECTPSTYNIEEIETWKVSTNTFQSQSLQKQLNKPNYSKVRQIKAEKLAEILYRSESPEVWEYLTTPPMIRPYTLLKSTTIAYISDTHYGLGRPNYDYRLELPPH